MVAPADSRSSAALRFGMTTRSRRWTQQRSASAGCAPRRRSSSTEPTPPTTGCAIKEVAHMTLSVDEPDPDDPLIADSATRPGRPGCTRTSSRPRTFPSSGTPGATRRGSSTTRAAAATSSRGSSNGSATIRRRGRRRSRPSSRCSTRATSRASACSTSGRRQGALELVVYAHSLDFGKKAYGNLVELARLQELVAGELGLPVGALTMLVKSAHVYEPEWELMARLAARRAPPGAG